MRTLTNRSFPEVTLEKARMLSNVATYFKEVKHGEAALVSDTYIEKDHAVIAYSYQTGVGKYVPAKLHVIEEVLDGEFHLENFRFQTTEEFLKVKFEIKVRIGDRWKIEATSDYLMFAGGLISQIFSRNPNTRYSELTKEVAHHFKLIGSYPQLLDVSIGTDSKGQYTFAVRAVKHAPIRDETQTRSILMQDLRKYLEATDQLETWNGLIDSLMFIDTMLHELRFLGPRLIPRTEYVRGSALHSVRVKNEVKRKVYYKQTNVDEDSTIFNEKI